MTDRSGVAQAAEPTRRLNRRSVLRNAGVGLGATGLVATAGSADAFATLPRGLSAADAVALYRLKTNYAIGTDAIGAGDFERGLELYRATFAADAQISAGFDREHPLLEAVGPDAYAESTRAALAGTLGSQHLLGTFAVEAGSDRRTANLTTYFHATVLSGSDQTITTYLGTYFDVARRSGRRWRLTESFAQYFSIQSGTRDAP